MVRTLTLLVVSASLLIAAGGAGASDGTIEEGAQPAEAVSPLVTPEMRHRGTLIQAAVAEGDTEWLESLEATDSEIAFAEKRERIRVQATPSTVRGALGSHYAGMYRDVSTGDVVALTTGATAEALDALTFVEGTPRVVPADYTFDQLDRWYHELVEALPPQTSVGLYVDRNRIGIGTTDARSFDLGSVPSQAVFFEPYEGDLNLELEDQADNHTSANMMSGLAMEFRNADGSGTATCTWGFNAYDTRSTVDRSYMLTSGHCVPDADDWTDQNAVDIDLYQTSSSAGTPCDNDCTVTKRGNDRSMYVRRTNHTDVGRIRSDAHGDSNCRHSTGECLLTITSVRDKSDDSSGDPVCASFPFQDINNNGNREDNYDCGTLQTPIWRSVTACRGSDCHTVTNARTVNAWAGSGNSGAPYAYVGEAIGMHFASNKAGLAYLVTAEDIEGSIGANASICTFDGCK